MKNTSSGNSMPSRDERIKAWLMAMKQACRLGPKTAKIEGSRLHADRTLFCPLTPFFNEGLIGWPAGNFFCITPRFMIELFHEDKRLFSKKHEKPFFTPPTGDLPVDVEIKSKGRISLPAALTIPTGILMNDDVITVPRSRGSLEIWSLKLWKKHYSDLTGLNGIEPEE